MIRKGDVVCRLGEGQFHPAPAPTEETPAFPCKYLGLGVKSSAVAQCRSATEKDFVFLYDGNLTTVEDMLQKANLSQGGTIWGADRVAPKRGAITLSFLRGHFVPQPVALVDLTLNNIGQILKKGPLDDYQLVFVLRLNGTMFEPPNGGNAAALVAKKNIVVSCGRFVRMK